MSADMWVCPFNKAHRLPYTQRVQRHLYKCQQANPGVTLTCCPFNAAHRVKPEDLSEHMATCKEAIVVHRDLIENEDDGFKDKEPEYLEEEFDNKVELDGEVWDNDNDSRAPGYDPSLVVPNLKIPRRPLHGAGKATQKQFRLEDCKRLEKLTENDRGMMPNQATNNPVIIQRPGVAETRGLPRSVAEARKTGNKKIAASIYAETENVPPSTNTKQHALSAMRGRGITLGRGRGTNLSLEDDNVPGRMAAEKRRMALGRGRLMEDAENSQLNDLNRDSSRNEKEKTDVGSTPSLSEMFNLMNDVQERSDRGEDLTEAEKDLLRRKEYMLESYNKVNKQ